MTPLLTGKPIRYGTNFFLYTLRNPSHLQAVLSFFPEHSPTSPPLRELIRTKCKSIIVETQYRDVNFTRAYARLYHRRHRETPRRCIRVHLFGRDIGDKTLEQGDIRNQHCYLGFIVFRPSPIPGIARAIIAASLLPTDILVDRQVFLTVRSEYRVNLAGQDIRFVGCPWLEQDNVISTCSTAAIWTVNAHFSAQYHPEFKIFHTAQITDLATRDDVSLGRSVPSKGMTGQQMMLGLSRMGYDPIQFTELGLRQSVRTLYHYVESSIPVILMLRLPNRHVRDGHTVVAIGHTIEAGPMSANSTGGQGKTTSSEFPHSSDYVSSFVVQDDSRGPFRLLEFTWQQGSVQKPIQDSSEYKDATKGISTPRREHLERTAVPILLRDVYGQRIEAGYVEGLIVPLPPWVSLEGPDADRGSIALLNSLSRNGFVDPPDLVARTFLMPSNELKRFWRETAKSAPDRLAIEEAAALRSHMMPRWVWMTEFICKSELLNKEKHDAWGFMLQDAGGLSPRGEIDTEIREDVTSVDALCSPIDFVCFRAPGKLWLGQEDGKVIECASQATDLSKWTRTVPRIERTIE